MFYRRKIILAILEIFGGTLEKVRLQKLLFLHSQKQCKADYDFIPYKFGCFSHSAQADLTTMVKKGLLEDFSTGLTKKNNISYFKMLKESDRKSILETKRLYGSLSGKGLMKHTYKYYPYYAINSIKSAEILSAEEMAAIDEIRPTNATRVLFTIGYEGISLEGYLNKLIKNNVKVLVDVRKNPLSMKFGFSKTLLKKFCESVGIQYMHFPDVGIESNQRQALNNQSDYDKLFVTYRNESLPVSVKSQLEILNVLNLNNRIALTCFEANICQCHRKPLSESIAELGSFDFDLIHI